MHTAWVLGLIVLGNYNPGIAHYTELAYHKICALSVRHLEVQIKDMHLLDQKT